MKRKLISIILTITMAVAFMPTFAFAVDNAEEMQAPQGSETLSDDSLTENTDVVKAASDGQDDEGGGDISSFNIEDYSFKLSKTKYYYDGQPHVPDVICEELEEGVDYDVIYDTEEYEYCNDVGDYEILERDPTGTGTYNVYITGIDPYYGYVPLDYTIVATTISLNKTSATLYLKGTLQLKATVKNPNGGTKYSSSNKKVATVSSKGKITAKAAGNATITVKNGFAKKTVKIKVKKPSLNFTSATIYLKKSKTLKITGKVGKATFKSSNKKVASVNKAGKIKAKKKGSCTITVKTNGITLKSKIKVKKKPPTYVYITRTGKRYHCDYYCWGLRNANAKIKVTLKTAKKRGFTPCHVCY